MAADVHPRAADSSEITVATVNVNGIRAAVRRGMVPWLDQHRPELLLLQEVRADVDILSGHLDAHLPGWRVVHHEGPKGRAGVAIASRLPVIAVRVGLSGEAEASAGRWVEADVELPGGGTLTAISVYVHAGTVGTPAMDLKYAFLDLMTGRLGELQAAGATAVVGGDLNVAHDQRDLKNWKGNRGKSGFLPQEQAYLTGWGERGWVDLAREHAGDVEGPYTWWSWRGQAFDNDTGWRIDYLWGSARVADAVAELTVDRAPSYAERWSDHAPVRARLAFQPA